MYELLQKLDSYLSALRPEFYSNLNAPLTDDQLDQLEELYSMKIPNDLRILYQWKNGQQADCYEAFVNNSMFIPLPQALHDASALTAMIGFDFEIENWWNEKWIPIFDNGSGDKICYDLGGIFTGQPGQLIEYWHADHDRNIITPTLESLIRRIMNFYETKPKEAYDEYFEIENMADYPKRFRVE